jgi:hypothetical protein
MDNYKVRADFNGLFGKILFLLQYSVVNGIDVLKVVNRFPLRILGVNAEFVLQKTVKADVFKTISQSKYLHYR